MFFLILQVHNQIESQVKNMIINYRDDEDLQNLVDWVQQDWVGASNGMFVLMHYIPINKISLMLGQYPVFLG